MTLSEKDKFALIKYRIQRADETIVEAKEALELNHLILAVNRIYYACFYSVEALMLTRDFSTKNHGVLKGEFNKAFIHSGILDKKILKLLIMLLKIDKPAIMEIL